MFSLIPGRIETVGILKIVHLVNRSQPFEISEILFSFCFVADISKILVTLLGVLEPWISPWHVEKLPYS